MQNSNDFSKFIDFVIVNYKKNKQFIVNSFDITVNSKVNIISNKIEKFLVSYNYFNNKKDKITINGKQYKIKLNYYVISDHDEES